MGVAKALPVIIVGGDAGAGGSGQAEGQKGKVLGCSVRSNLSRAEHYRTLAVKYYEGGINECGARFSRCLERFKTTKSQRRLGRG